MLAVILMRETATKTIHKEQFFACDFLTVETLTLQTVYVLFFIEHATRRVHFAGCTAHPDKIWRSQQARQLTWTLEDDKSDMRFLIRDNDTKFAQAFDAIFEAAAIEIVKTPFYAPNTNAIVERWVRTVREECLNKIIILNEVHLRRVLKEYTQYYNTRRPHQGIEQNSPDGFEISSQDAPIRCRKVLGGIIRDYYREAA